MKPLFFAVLLSLSFSSSFSYAEDMYKASKSAKYPKMEWTTLQRENMAKMHESMATCLRSNKSVHDCRAEMKTSCKDMGKEGCPSMHGRGHHGMSIDE